MHLASVKGQLKCLSVLLEHSSVVDLTTMLDKVCYDKIDFNIYMFIFDVFIDVLILTEVMFECFLHLLRRILTRILCLTIMLVVASFIIVI